MTTEDTTLREFSITSNSGTRTSQDFNKIRVDGKMLQNDVTFLTDYFDMRKKHFHRHGRPFFTKEDVVRALAENNVLKLRFFSEFFFRTSGIYSRLCRYMAYLYKYDYFITPISYDNKVKPEKVIEG